MGPLYIRCFASVATILLFLTYWQGVHSDIQVFLTLVLMLLAYFFLIWFRKNGWSTWPYFTATLIFVTGAALLKVHAGVEGDQPLPLFLPLLWLLASMPRKSIKASAVLAVFLLAAIALLDRDNPNLLNLLIGAFGLYSGVRGITFLKEGNRISTQNLNELDEAHTRLQQAHDELQVAGVHSMRYAALSERTRLARDIHDGIGHHLTSLIVQLQALEMMLPDDPEAASEQVKLMLPVARKAMREVRGAVHEWSEDESGMGLIALQGLVSQSAANSRIRFEFHGEDDDLPNLSTDASVILYRILQEAITNMMKHSEATDARIRIQAINGSAVLTVSDNGPLTDVGNLKPGFGMKGMIRRCESAGGTVSFACSHPHGLTVRAEILLQKEALLG